MFKMFSNANLLNINICNRYKNDDTVLTSMFSNCSSLKTKSVKVSKDTYDKLLLNNCWISADKFDIIN